MFSNVLLSFFQVLATAFAARRLGRMTGLIQKWDSGLLAWVFETAVGYGCLSYFLFTAACFHWISPLFLKIVLAALLPLALWEMRLLVKVLLKTQIAFHPFYLLAGAVYCLWILLGAVLPPSDRDELIYQLEIPRQLLLSGGFRFFPENPYAYFPQFASMLTLLGLGGAGEIAAKLYHASFGILTAVSIYALGRKFLSQALSFFAAAIFLTVPTVMVLMPLAYVDLTYAFYTTLAAAVLLNERESLWNRVMGAGVMAGCAAAIKYPGLQFAGLLMVLGLVQFLKDRRKLWLAALPGIGFFAVLFIAPYLIRNFSFTGWPLFPFPSAHLPLHSGIAWSAEQADYYLLWLGQYGTPLGQAAALHTLAAPLLVFITARFNEPQFYDGVLGPVFLLIPFLLFRRTLPVTLKKVGIFSLLFLYYWAVTTKQVRFLIPVLPFLCLLLAYGLQERKQIVWKAICSALIAGNVICGAGQVWTRDPAAFWTGRETRENYLGRQLPVYKIYTQTNARLKETDRVFLIHMKNYGYYLNIPWSGDYIFERYRLDKFLETAQTPESLAGFFENLKVNYLLIDEAHLQSREWGMSGESLRLFKEFLAAHAHLTAREQSYGLYQLTA